mgnify:FL=1
MRDTAFLLPLARSFWEKSRLGSCRASFFKMYVVSPLNRVCEHLLLLTLQVQRYRVPKQVQQRTENRQTLGKCLILTMQDDNVGIPSDAGREAVFGGNVSKGEDKTMTV